MQSKLEGRWSALQSRKKQFKPEIFDWDQDMIDYVHGKTPTHAWQDWSKVNIVSI